MKNWIICFLVWLSFNPVFSQPVPAVEESIPYLVTFGSEGKPEWGDDDHIQIFFFVIPENTTLPVFFRVFDPDISGENDEKKGEYNTKTKFSVYGGAECFSHKDAQLTDPVGNYLSGNLIASKTFSNDSKYDQNWYTFGPFNPTEGELLQAYGGYIFKVIAQGSNGDDGNLYRYFMSSSGKENIAIEGGNAFTFEYSFRLSANPDHVSHIYPYIDDRVQSVKQSNFDWDNDGIVRIVSVAKKGEYCKTSSDGNWVNSTHNIVTQEYNTSLDIQFIKNKKNPMDNNNVVMYITNQYNELLPFYTIPIGGIPKYKYKIGVKPRGK